MDINAKKGFRVIQAGLSFKDFDYIATTGKRGQLNGQGSPEFYLIRFWIRYPLDNGFGGIPHCMYTDSVTRYLAVCVR